MLVANRGEIAVRVMQACAEAGLASVAVYSGDDAGALHVRRANAAVQLAGDAGGTSAYLDVAQIVEAARSSGAGAIHPGYGFLSENPHLAEACRAAGIVFVGPPPEAMRLLGNKPRARALARSLGIPVVPGTDGPAGRTALDDATLLAGAAAVGFPLLIKAAAGGGGRGMRLVPTAGDLPGSLDGARREARAAFGDPAVFLERQVTGARHVEVQVLADAYRNVVHLGERECSVQRRHQKVLEECPAPALAPALRDRLGEEATRLLRAAGYVNAGTVEFLVAPDGEHYFLEVNTRLQVEHPITELVTGIDLVQEQLTVAAGRPLSFRQEDVRRRGHALQCRVYAEDPGEGFRPAPGTLLLFDPPLGPGLRHDAGVETGDEVSPRYDPLLAKLIVSAPDRAQCLARAGAALRRYAVLGVTTNLSLLQAVVDDSDFRAGGVDTGFLERHLPDLLAGAAPDEGRLLLAGAGWRLTAGFGRPPAPTRGAWSPWGAGPWRAGAQSVPLRFRLGEREVACPASALGDGRWDIDLPIGRLVGSTPRPAPPLPSGRRTVGFRRTGPATLVVDEGPEVWTARVVEDGPTLHVAVDGRSAVLSRPAGLTAETGGPAPAGVGRPQALTAPVPGVVVQVHVRAGDAVDVGQPLVVLEAMKTEFAVTAPYRGTVRRVAHAPGDRVPAGAVLVELEP